MRASINVSYYEVAVIVTDIVDNQHDTKVDQTIGDVAASHNTHIESLDKWTLTIKFMAMG